MLTIDFSDVNRLIKGIDGLGKQLPFVMSRALTESMKDARTAEIAVMNKVFANPVPWTLNSLRVTPATKTNLKAQLGWREFGGKGLPAFKYLKAEVEGGPRKPKAFELALRARGLMRPNEFAVPSDNVQLDPNGNVPGGLIRQILSALGASQDPTSNTRKGSKRRKSKLNRSYFVSRPKGGGAAGIYIRVSRFPVLVMLFVRAPIYSRRFPFYEEARRVIPRAFVKHFHTEWEKVAKQELARATR